MRKLILYIVIAISLILSANAIDYCYQESANDSTQTSTLGIVNGQCGQIYNGTYHEGLYPQIRDGNWTSGLSGAYEEWINYTKPIGSVGAVWLVKDDQGIYNLSINNDCWSTTNVLRLRMYLFNSPNTVSWYCYNATYNETLLRTSIFNPVYEEGIYWIMNSTSYLNAYMNGELITNVNLDWYLNNTKVGSGNPFVTQNYFGYYNLTILSDSNSIGNYSAYVNINYTVTNYSYYFTTRNITLNFSQATDGYIISETADNYQLYNWTNLNTVNVSLAGMPTSKISAYYRKTATTNNYNVYEFYTNKKSDIYENIYVLATPNLDFWINVKDNAGNPRPETLIKIYQYNTTWGTGKARLIGQRYGSVQLGNYKAMTDFYIDSSLQLLYVLNSTDYQTKANNIDIIRQNYSSSYPLDVILNTLTLTPSTYSLYCTQKNDENKNLTVYCRVNYDTLKTITVNTNYRIANNMPPKRTTLFNPVTVVNDQGIFTGSIIVLEKLYQQMVDVSIVTEQHDFTLDYGLDYSTDISQTNETIYVYEDGVLIGQTNIFFNSNANEEIGDIGAQTYDSSIFTFLLFIMIILLSTILQFFFNESKVGLHSFMIGGILIAFINTAFIMLAVVCLSYYLLKMIKPIVGAFQ